MINDRPEYIRILVVDDEPEILDIYLETLRNDSKAADSSSHLHQWQPRSFGSAPHTNPMVSVKVDVASQAGQAVDMIARSVEEDNPFSVVFLDVRMPPGPDGLWAAKEIRALDPNVEILIVTAFSDVHPLDISLSVPPPDKLFYVQKPFHPQEIEQFAYALAAKWRAERLLEEVNRELEKKVRQRTAELEKANRRLARLAVTDELTGLYNRRHFHNVLETEFSRAVRYSRDLSILMVDLDRFKNVNDQYGHHVGDEALRHVGDILKGHTRGTDLPARFGGEEFTVILLETGAEMARRKAEELRRLFENEPVVTGKITVRLTASIGVASYPAVGESSDRLLRAADEALYQAKNAGRNRVVVWTPA